MQPTFPPELENGSRVWTHNGYQNHGPLEGPHVNIVGNMGGVVESVSKPFMATSSLLYSIRWDNGQLSKHYSNGLFCIGRFKTFADFVAAIRVEGPVELTEGPQGGFREVRMRLSYDGVVQDVRLEKYDQRTWEVCLEPIVRTSCLEIRVTSLAPKTKKRKKHLPSNSKLGALGKVLKNHAISWKSAVSPSQRILNAIKEGDFDDKTEFAAFAAVTVLGYLKDLSAKLDMPVEEISDTQLVSAITDQCE